MPDHALGWLVVAFGLGAIHALDADHVMAVSLLASGGRGAREGARAGLRWSMGHGLVVLAAGIVLLALGQALPASVTRAADGLIGVVLVALGLWVWLELVRQRAHVHFHAHDGFLPHAHWHGHARPDRIARRDGRPDDPQVHASVHASALAHTHAHAPLFVGALHGLAGSAPILALLPILRTSPTRGLAALVAFGLGVALAMVAVSGLLGHLAGRLSRTSQSRGFVWLRGLGATGSVVLGVWMIAISL